MSSGLQGKRVVVTRPRNKGGKLVERLEEAGAIPILLPATEIAEPEDVSLLDQVLNNLGDFDWLVFTSANGVESVGKRLQVLCRSLDEFPHLKIAVVGPGTAEALETLGRSADAMPLKFMAEEIAKAIPNVSGSRILLARGDLARSEFPEQLSRLGATVIDITAYRALRCEAIWDLQEEPMPDAITVLSGEAARATIETLRDFGLQNWLENVPIACIGPVTAATLIDEKLTPAIVAEEHTIEGLMQSLETLFSAPQVRTQELQLA